MHNNGRFVIARLGSTQIILPFLYPAAKLTAHLGFVRVSELHSSVIVQLSRINPLPSCFRVSPALYRGIEEPTTVKLTECGKAWHKTDCRRPSI